MAAVSSLSGLETRRAATFAAAIARASASAIVSAIRFLSRRAGANAWAIGSAISSFHSGRSDPSAARPTIRPSPPSTT